MTIVAGTFNHPIPFKVSSITGKVYLYQKGDFKRTDFFNVFSVLRVASGPRVKLAGCKSVLTSPPPPPHARPHPSPSPPPPPPRVVYSSDRSRAVVPVLVLLFYSTRRFVLSLALCYFLLVPFSLFSIAITSLGEERANLSAFHPFVRFALVCGFNSYYSKTAIVQ